MFENSLSSFFLIKIFSNIYHTQRDVPFYIFYIPRMDFIQIFQCENDDEKGVILKSRSAFYPRVGNLDCSFKRVNFSYLQKKQTYAPKNRSAPVFTFRIVNMLTRVDFRGKQKRVFYLCQYFQQRVTTVTRALVDE